jgi:hypothetical protein
LQQRDGITRFVGVGRHFLGASDDMPHFHLFSQCWESSYRGEYLWQKPMVHRQQRDKTSFSTCQLVRV